MNVSMIDQIEQFLSGYDHIISLVTFMATFFVAVAAFIISRTALKINERMERSGAYEKRKSIFDQANSQLIGALMNPEWGFEKYPQFERAQVETSFLLDSEVAKLMSRIDEFVCHMYGQYFREKDDVAIKHFEHLLHISADETHAKFLELRKEVEYHMKRYLNIVQ
jgi:hypothetical protein